MRCLRSRLARCKKYVIPVELSDGRLHRVFKTKFRAFSAVDAGAAGRFTRGSLGFLVGVSCRVFEGSGEYFAAACVTAGTCVIPEFVQEMQKIANLLFKCRKCDHIHFCTTLHTFPSKYIFGPEFLCILRG